LAALARAVSSGALGLNRARVCALGLALALSACRPHRGAELYAIVGPNPEQHVEFSPLSSYAEYLVIPGVRRELKITLASYKASCDSFVEPGDRDTSATITLIVPADVELGPGSYVWAGHEAHGGSEERPERPYALPLVRLGHHGFVLPAGGEIQLDSVATAQDGRVRGLLNFEFAGDGDHAAASLKGSFEAKLCKVRL
jgi:hypothetical protein